MNSFSILNSRKRAIIALIHSVFFGLLACYQLIANYHPTPLVAALPGHILGPVILTTIYLLVTTILLVPVILSRSAIEKLYFAFCATSAGVGLFRVVLGDPTVYAGNLVRVLMLGCGIVTGMLILRIHSEAQPEFAA